MYICTHIKHSKTVLNCTKTAPTLHQLGTCKRLKLTKTAAPKLHQNCTTTAPKLHQNCTKTAPKLHQNSTNTYQNCTCTCVAPELHQTAQKTAPELHLTFVHNVPKLHLENTKTAAKMRLQYIWPAPKLHLECTQTAPFHALLHVNVWKAGRQLVEKVTERRKEGRKDGIKEAMQEGRKTGSKKGREEGRMFTHEALCYPTLAMWTTRLFQPTNTSFIYLKPSAPLSWMADCREWLSSQSR